MRETLLAMKPSIMRRHLVSANGHEENVGEGGEREREREGEGKRGGTRVRWNVPR